MFTTTDPLGRGITLTAKTWNTHISNRHTVLDQQIKAVQKTIEDPEIILPDKEHANRENYFRLCIFPIVPYIVVLKVVTDLTGGVRQVWTAYTVEDNMRTQTSIPKGGAIYVRP